MNRKSVMAVMLSVMVLCFTGMFTQSVYADTTTTITNKGKALYPYNQVKQDAIRSLQKAERTLDWNDITDAWMKVDGLTMHPDYNGDSEVNALNDRVNALFDKFSAQKSEEALKQSTPSQPAQSTPAPATAVKSAPAPTAPVQTAPVQTAPSNTNSDSINGKKIIKVEEKVTVTPIPAPPLDSKADTYEGNTWQASGTAQGKTNIVESPIASLTKNSAEQKSAQMGSETQPATTNTKTAAESKLSVTVPKFFGLNTIADAETITNAENGKTDTAAPAQTPNTGVFAGIAAIIAAFIKSIKSTF